MRAAFNTRSMPLLVIALLVGGGLAGLIANAIAGGSEPAAPPAVAQEDQEQPEPEAQPHGARRDEEPDLHPEDENDANPLTRPAEGEASAAGADPAAVARRFGELWVNRVGGADLLRLQRRELVALSRGAWARQLDLEYRDAIKRGGLPTTTEGEITAVERAPREGAGDSAGYLVVARERLLRDGRPLEPYRYATYLARMTDRDGGWAVTAWEPQI